MADIKGTQNEKVFQIKKWLGVNISHYGDTKLKMGEAAVMRNFRITRDGNLQKRPGARLMWPENNTGENLYGAWAGIIGGKQYVIVISERLGSLDVFSIYDADTDSWADIGIDTKIGTITKPAPDTESIERPIFEFEDKVCIFGYTAIYTYDGTTFAAVTPYRPIVAINVAAQGQMDLFEQVNKLSGTRRIWLSPDGTNKSFAFPEDATSLDYVKLTADGSSVTTGYGTIMHGTKVAGILFDNAPAAGSNTYEVGYTVSYTAPSLVLDGMKYTELYNGDQYNRVFAYGNGTNQAYYTGYDYETGTPEIGYWPDLNVMNVGDKSEQITNLIRYNSRLVAFTDHGTYSIQYGQMTLADGNLIAAFYVVPVHRDIGSDVPNTAQMVMNTPVVVFKKDVYSWAGNKYGNLSADERQAKRISDRIQIPLSGMDVNVCFDDNYNQEYYICGGGGKIAVWNYANDAWYLYDRLYVYYMFSMNNKLYYIQNRVDDTDGNMIRQMSLYQFDETYTRDDFFGALPEPVDLPIDCYWESGSMDFGVDYQRKYSAMLWVGVMPASHADVWVTAKTDRSSELTEKLVAHWYSTFLDANFGKWSFNTSHRPKLKRLKIKAKKFVYYKLIFKSTDDDNTAVITTADIRVRFTGYAK